MPTIKLPPPFRTHADGQELIDVQASTVQDAIEDLVKKHPRLREGLFDQEGGLRPYVVIFLNGEDIGGLDGGSKPVEEEDQLMIVPSIAGGKDSTLETRADPLG